MKIDLLYGRVKAHGEKEIAVVPEGPYVIPYTGSSCPCDMTNL